MCREEGKEHTDDSQQQGPMTLGELAKKMVVQLLLGLKIFLEANKNCQGKVIVLIEISRGGVPDMGNM